MAASKGQLLTGFLTMCEAVEKSTVTGSSSPWMGLWWPEQNSSHWSRETKCTQAGRELARQQEQGDRKGFALDRPANDQSETRYQPQEAAPSRDTPCAPS